MSERRAARARGADSIAAPGSGIDMADLLAGPCIDIWAPELTGPEAWYAARSRWKQACGDHARGAALIDRLTGAPMSWLVENEAKTRRPYRLTAPERPESNR